MKPSARTIAAEVVRRVADEDAYASVLLDRQLRDASLAPRDAALATEIVYGTLRVLPALDARIQVALTRKGQRVEPFVHAALRTATYQLVHLERVPAHAVVHEAVSLVRHARGEGMARFTNAVLRAIARDAPPQRVRPEHVNVSDEVRRVFEDGIGHMRTQHALGARPLPPPIVVRARRAKTDRDALHVQLAERLLDARIVPARFAPDALEIHGGGDPRTWSGFDEGHFVVQDEGAQLVALALGARPGERIADLCAGHGGKTLALLDAVGGDARVTAVDLHEPKLHALRRDAARLGLPAAAISTHTIDLTRGVGRLEAEFDRVLVDAPCSGLGTLQRRPEIALRFRRDKLASLRETQRRTLANAARLVRAGGELFYAVCSPARDECASIIDDFLNHNEDFQRTPVATTASLEADADGTLRIVASSSDSFGPDVHQLARLVRVK